MIRTDTYGVTTYVLAINFIDNHFWIIGTRLINSVRWVGTLHTPFRCALLFCEVVQRSSPIHEAGIDRMKMVNDLDGGIGQTGPNYGYGVRNSILYLPHRTPRDLGGCRLGPAQPLAAMHSPSRAVCIKEILIG